MQHIGKDGPFGVVKRSMAPIIKEPLIIEDQMHSSGVEDEVMTGISLPSPHRVVKSIATKSAGRVI